MWGIDHLLVPPVQEAMDAVHRVMGTPPRPIGVLLRLQVGFEHRLKHEQGRCVNGGAKLYRSGGVACTLRTLREIARILCVKLGGYFSGIRQTVLRPLQSPKLKP